MADENIIIKITSESDLTSAQVGLKDLQDKAKELERNMQSLTQAEKADAESIKALGLSSKELSAALNENNKYYTKLRESKQNEINANAKSIQSYKESISTYNAVNNATGKLTTQIRAMREQLAQMEMAGDTSSQAFIDLSVKAAQLQDQLGDTTRQISILASDTKNLDAAMSVGSGLTGVFTAATGAMALLGGESEELQQAFFKVQAAISVLNGVQEVANVLNKDSAANVVIRTALQKLFNKSKVQEAAATTASATASAADTVAKGAEATATTAATTAQWSLNTAMLANPVMLIVAGIAALVAGIAFFVSSSKKAAEEQRNFNGILEDTKNQMDAIKETSDYNARLKEAEGGTWREVATIRKEGAEKANQIAEAKYNEMQVKAKKARGKLSDEEKEAMEKQKEIVEESRKALVAIEQDWNIKEAEEAYNAQQEKLLREKEYQKRRKEEIANATKELEDATIAAMRDGADKEIASIELRHNRKLKTITGNSKAERALRKALTEQTEREIQAVREKYAAEERAALRDAGVIVKELAAMQSPFDAWLQEEAVRAKADATIASLNEQLAALGEDEVGQRAQINAKIQAEEVKLSQDIAKIQVEDKERSLTFANEQLKRAQDVAEEEYLAFGTSRKRRAQLEQEMANRDAQMKANELASLEAKYNAMLMSDEEYQRQKAAIEDEYADRSEQRDTELLNKQLGVAQQALQLLGDVAGEVFGIIQDKIAAELEALDEMYTTDAEEAKENASKKYISEKELEDKKRELKRKAAAAEKAEAVFSIGLNTAMAIMQAIAQFGPPPSPMGIVGIAMATTLGAVQLAAALAKPLPQYAKGRKGGKGEYALVGERGPELMYVPSGASIVPNHQLGNMDAWGAYGVPQLNIPPLPNYDAQGLAMAMQVGMPIDYERLGKAVADNIPRQNAVMVNIDRDGIVVKDGRDTHEYMNSKYTGQWI